MKSHAKHIRKNHDDSLYGLLLSYKANNTYIKILSSEKENSIALLITDNPKNWSPLRNTHFKEYSEVRRLDIRTDRLLLKYLHPQYLIAILGPSLGIKVPIEKLSITDILNEEGCYIIQTSLKYKQRVLMGIRKILNMSPQKKYEIIEKCIAEVKD